MPPSADPLIQLPQSRPCEAQTGEIVVRPGLPDDHIFQVQQGRLRVYLNGPDRELTLTTLGPGSVFASHTRAWIKAETPSRYTRIPLPTFLQAVAKQPAMAMAAFAGVGHALQSCIDLVENISFRNVEGRLAHWLLTHLDASAATSKDIFELDLSGEAVGKCIGASRQSVSTTLSRFCRQGLITRHSPRHVQVNDRQTLQQFAYR